MERVVREGLLTGYQLAGQYLRLRPDEVRALRDTIRAAPPHTATVARQRPESWVWQVKEFIYFYDFYLVSAGLLAALVIYLIATG